MLALSTGRAAAKRKPSNSFGAIPVSALCEWLQKKDVVTSVDELTQYIASFHSSRYEKAAAEFGSAGAQGSGSSGQFLLYRDFLEHIVLPVRKDKLREKILKRSGLIKGAAGSVKKKKAPSKQSVTDDGTNSMSAVSGVSKETSNSVERRKEEEAAKISVDYAMALIFEQELKLHRLISIVKQKIMKTNFNQIVFREIQPQVDIIDEQNDPSIQAIPPSTTDLNFIEAFNMMDRQRKGHITK
jgi:hypothetical protein